MQVFGQLQITRLFNFCSSERKKYKYVKKQINGTLYSNLTPFAKLFIKTVKIPHSVVAIKREHCNYPQIIPQACLALKLFC
jgi:hypothetical protein